MLILLYNALAALLAITALTYFRILRGISYTGGVPRVGSPGVLGYIVTALKYTFNATSIIAEGRSQFSGRPFVLPTLVSQVYQK